MNHVKTHRNNSSPFIEKFISKIFITHLHCIFFFLISGQYLIAQPILTEIERNHVVQNRIKSVKIFSLRLNKDYDKRTFLDNLIRYDRNGNISEQIFYDSLNLEMLKWTMIYNDKRINEIVICAYRDTIAKTYFQYNEKGFLSEEQTVNADGVPLEKFIYQCDSRGRISFSKAEFFPEMTALVKQIYKFDKVGFVLLRFLGNAKSGSKLNFNYEYSKTGLLNKITETNQDTASGGAVFYDFTRTGLIKEYMVKHINGKRYRCYYKYDDHGNLKEESKNFLLNTVLLDQERNEFTCDRKGKITKRLRYRMSNELYMLYNYSYEFYE